MTNFIYSVKYRKISVRFDFQVRYSKKVKIYNLSF